MPLTMRTDVIDQILAICVHPAYDCYKAKVSVEVILNLTQSPETHAYIVGREVVQKMLDICEQKQKIVSKQSSHTQQGKKDLMTVNLLKYVTIPPLHVIITTTSIMTFY